MFPSVTAPSTGENDTNTLTCPLPSSPPPPSSLVCCLPPHTHTQLYLFRWEVYRFFPCTLFFDARASRGQSPLVVPTYFIPFLLCRCFFSASLPSPFAPASTPHSSSSSEILTDPPFLSSSVCQPPSLKLSPCLRLHDPPPPPTPSPINGAPFVEGPIISQHSKPTSCSLSLLLLLPPILIQLPSTPPPPEAAPAHVPHNTRTQHKFEIKKQHHARQEKASWRKKKQSNNSKYAKQTNNRSGERCQVLQNALPRPLPFPSPLCHPIFHVPRQQSPTKANFVTSQRLHLREKKEGHHCFHRLPIFFFRCIVTSKCNTSFYECIAFFPLEKIPSPVPTHPPKKYFLVRETFTPPPTTLSHAERSIPLVSGSQRSGLRPTRSPRNTFHTAYSLSPTNIHPSPPNQPQTDNHNAFRSKHRLNTTMFNHVQTWKTKQQNKTRTKLPSVTTLPVVRIVRPLYGGESSSLTLNPSQKAPSPPLSGGGGGGPASSGGGCLAFAAFVFLSLSAPCTRLFVGPMCLPRASQVHRTKKKRRKKNKINEAHAVCHSCEVIAMRSGPSPHSSSHTSCPPPPPMRPRHETSEQQSIRAPALCRA